MSVSGKRVALFALAVMFLAAALTPLIPNKNVSAAQITPRSLTLQAGAGGDGGSQPSGTVNHLFTFTLPSTPTLGSIQFQYCTTSTGTCTPPTGLDVSSVTLGASTGAVFTSVTSTDAHTAYVSRVPALYSGGVVTVGLDGAVNPGPTPGSFFARISTYALNNATGTPIDTGTVTASTATQIQLSGIMPESLIFCTGATIDVNASNLPQCSSATSGAVDFNQLFTPQGTTWATSQLAASTNATTGYAITVNGGTLTSGSNTIPAIGGTAAASAPGSGQFGMNLVDDSADATIGTASANPITYYTDPASHGGGDVYPAANGTNYRGQAKANFNTASSFAFAAGSANTVAASDNGGAGPTDGQRFTATYIVNVSGSQPAGTYVSTLTYICTPTF